MPINRTDFQKLADQRVIDAKALLDAGKWAAAYYLVGYAVECALKACISKMTSLHDFPPARTFVEDCYTHSIDRLLKAAGLKNECDVDINANSPVGRNWMIVKDWTEQTRYLEKTQLQAEKLYLAITNNTNGVLPWIKSRW